MLKLISWSVALLLCLCSNAQTREIQLTIHDVPENVSYSLFLSAFNKGSFDLVDSVEVSYTDTIVEFTVPNSQPAGLFRLSTLVDNNSVEFLYNPTENIELEASYWGIKNGDILTYNSPENSAYTILLQLQEQYTRIHSQLIEDKKLVSPYYQDYRRQWGNLEAKIETLQIELNRNLDSIISRYPGTYTSDVLVSLTRIPVRSQEQVKEFDGYLSFLNQHYFDFVDFEDDRILRHYAFMDKVFYYLTEYTEKTEDGTKVGLDYLLSLMKSNDQVNSHLFNNLLQTFLDLDSEVFTLYLTENVQHGCSIDLDFTDLKKLSSIKTLSIGGQAPDLLLYDDKNNAQSLYANCKKNKITIVYIWISWCSHCQKTTPRLKLTYDLYKKKGLGIFAVSLDENETLWKDALKTNNTNWLNTAELVPIKQSKVAPSYNVSTTPAIFVLDPSGKVLAKNLFGDDLDKWLSDYLK